MCKQNLRSGFTLLEVVISVSILAGMTGLILVMLDAPERLLATRDVQRQSNAKQVQNALEQEFFETSTIEIAMSATPTPICRLGITADVDPDCVSLDYLVPEYIPCLPVDGAEPDTDRTGYAVAFEDIQPSTVALYLGQKGGQNTFCESEAAPIFGDGNLDPGEECDDGNRDSSDGCNEFAMLEDGFNCEQPSQTNPTYCEQSVTDPSNPIVFESDSSLSKPTDVFVAGSLPYAYVVDAYSNTFFIYDVSNPNEPRLLHQITDGDTVTDENTGLDTVADSLHMPSSIFVSGNYAYITSGYDGSQAGYDHAFTIFKLNGSNEPTLLSVTRDAEEGQFTKLRGASDVVIRGNYAFVTAIYDHSLTIIDISEPENPTFVSSVTDNEGGFDSIGYPSSVDVSGDYAYVTSFPSDNALTIIDISVPETPREAAVVTSGQPGFGNFLRPSQVDVDGGKAYITSIDSNALVAIDVQDEENPVPAGYYSDILLQGAYDVVVSDNVAYVAAANGDTFMTLDVSVNPPDRLDYIKDDETTELDGVAKLFIYGSYAYVVSQTDNSISIIGVR